MKNRKYAEGVRYEMHLLTIHYINHLKIRPRAVERGGKRSKDLEPVKLL